VGFGADINAEDNTGYRPLHCATISRNLGTIKAMLDHNANIDDRCQAENNGTVLHLAVSERSDAECAKSFLEKGLPVDAQDNLGNTPLHKAVAASVLEAVEALLEYKADVDARNHQGMTPFHELLYRIR
jgi:ankyrin repeat protein